MTVKEWHKEGLRGDPGVSICCRCGCKKQKEKKELGWIVCSFLFHSWCYGMNVCIPLKFVFESLNSLGDDICNVGSLEVIRCRWGYEDGASWWDECPYKKLKRPEPSLSSTWRYSMKMALSKNLTMSAPCSQMSSLPNCRRCLLFKPPSLWYFVAEPELTQSIPASWY